MQNVLAYSKKITLALAVLAVLVLGLPVAAHAAPAQGSNLAIPVGGTFTDATGGTGHFAGTFNLQHFAVQNGKIVALGTVVGTLTDAAGNVLGSVVQTVTAPVSTAPSGAAAAAPASCDILHLELGPLDLNLLGLTVHLNQVVLDIAAQPGAGNLLGNLLCAVANLLNGTGTGGALNGITQLLNQILGILQGL